MKRCSCGHYDAWCLLCEMAGPWLRHLWNAIRHPGHGGQHG